MIRIWLAFAVAGAAAVQMLAYLPSNPGRWTLLAAFGSLLQLSSTGMRHHEAALWWRALQLVLWALLAGAVGFGYAAWRAQAMVADSLSPEHENLVTRLTVQVSGLATAVRGGQRFEAQVLHAPVPGIPRRLIISWYDANASWQAAARHTNKAPVKDDKNKSARPLVQPGEVYRLALVLKRPHGLSNPHSFDYEAWLFERGLRATGTVRGTPQRLSDAPFSSFSIATQRLRHYLRAAIGPYVEGTRYGPVILALAMGDQASVDKNDWATFNRLGITHLVSISGSHVTILAAGAAFLAMLRWKRARWRGVPLAEYIPAQVGGAAIALLIAWIYCLVAGWGVPAQRTFFMLGTVAVAAMARLPLSASRVLLAAAALVTGLDPWAPLAPGFWLSFGAVAVLMAAGTGRWRVPPRHRWRRMLADASALQLAITLALVPVLAFQFNEVSFASPLANAVAIPVVTFIVTPLALAALLLAPLPMVGGIGGGLAWLAERIFAWMMLPIDYLANSRWAMLSVASPPWYLVVLACLGVAWALQPRGLPGRWAAWLMIVPCVCYQPPRPQPGTYRLTVLDVGQGAAAVIETAEHVVVVDTGPPFGVDSDAGERVVWPYLRARGIRRIDDLIITHADVDHAGGVASLLQHVDAVRIRASYRLPKRISADNLPLDAAFAPCRAGQGWVLDGIMFTFLHPNTSEETPRDTNANSCVLRVQGVQGSALLPGDIGQREEQQLVRRYGSAVKSEVVLMAHHGSLTSSAGEFVQAVAAQHAVAQAGYLSRFGHPRPEVVQRWRDAEAVVHRSDHHGAVIFEVRHGRLRVRRQRDVARRYWHTTYP